MKEILKDLREKLWAAKLEVEKYGDAIRALQNTCEHGWKSDGHGHNEDYYKCSICGKEESR